MLQYGMVCHAVSCCITLCYDMSCDLKLRYVMLCCVMLWCVMLWAVRADFLYVFRKSSRLDVCVCGHAMMCRVMSRYAMSCNAMTCNVILYCSISCYVKF